MEHRTVEEHVAGLRTAVRAFERYAVSVGPDAEVPTCPTWTVRKLLAHQGIAHRGRRPAPDEADWVDPEVALDGIDELLTGFVTPGRSKFAHTGPLRFEVRPREGGRAWRVDVQPDGAVVTTRLGDGDPDGTTLAGSAVALYLALWNRADPAAVEDPASVLSDVWRERARVRWG